MAPQPAAMTPIPPSSSTNQDATSEQKKVQPVTTIDAEALLDSIDSYTLPSSSTSTPSSSSSSRPFDPISFLNSHFPTESTLSTNLPTVLTAISNRISTLDDSISSSIHHQAEISNQTSSELSIAKTAISNLSHRIALVQRKAQMSEKAVIEITRDMKRLDYAKRHLQRTITALKRLHMLMNAVEQLKESSEVGRWKECANLLDAVRLLLRHFEGYSSIERVREVREVVQGIRKDLKERIFHAFEKKSGMVDSRERVGSGGVSGAGVESAGMGGGAGNLASPGRGMPVGGNSSQHGQVQQGQPQEPPHEQLLNNNSSSLTSNSSLAKACLVIDALGPDIRTSLIGSFCNSHLSTYPKLFSPDANAPTYNQRSFKIISQDGEPTSNLPYSLDQVERRFAWFRRVLRGIDDAFENVFPPSWHVHYTLTADFLKLSREHFVMLLQGPNKDRDWQNVTVLLKALQKSILFEKEMTAWLMREYGVKFRDPTDEKGRVAAPPTGETGEELEFDEEGNPAPATSAQGIRIKYVRQMEKRKKNRENKNGDVAEEGLYRQSSTDANDPLAETDTNTEEDKPLPPLITMASSAFEDFMSPYIALERENMDEQLSKAATDKAVDTRGELPVFTSSTNLFVYIKNSITRCTALTNNQTFFQLYQAFQETLRKYATVLSQKFPTPITTPAAVISLTSLSSNPSPTYRIPPNEEITICHVIDTCEYCADTVEALEELIRDKIHPDFKSQIDMTGEQESFYDVTAKGIRVLVSGLELRTETAFKEMYSRNWAACENVGEESSYVRSMHCAIQPFVEEIQSLLPSSYFKNFCDKFATAFTSSYYHAVIRLKRISELGTQQLLLDVYNLKTLLLKLPIMKRKTETPSSSSCKHTAIPPAMYTKMVTKEFTKMEMLLKLVGTPTDQLTDMFKAYWPSGTVSDLQIVMNLKGVNRKEQQKLIETMGLDKGAAAAGSGAREVVQENLQLLSERSSMVADKVADKVNSDLSHMRQKVDDFRKAFR